MNQKEGIPITNMTDLLIFPYGGNSREAADVVYAINQEKPTWNLLGFLDDDPLKKGQLYRNVSVLGGRELLGKYPDAKILMVVGSPHNYLNRDKIISGLKIPADRYASLIHPSVKFTPSVKMGCNVLIMANVVLTANVSIGNHCLIRPNAVLSHETVIKDYSIIGSNVSISGSVMVEELCYVGAGVQIKESVTIGRGAMLGMGAVVVKSVAPHTTVVGNPARPLKKS